MGGKDDEPQQTEGWKEKIMLKMLYHPATWFRIQLLVHYTFLVLKSNSHIIKVKWCFQATIIFSRTQ